MRERFEKLPGYTGKDLEDVRVAVVGLGATGSVIAEHLARHGVKLLLVDRDYLEENDLYSSNVYRREHVEEALPKAEAAARQLERYTEVDYRVESLDAENLEMLDGMDLVMDGTDNLGTRRLINAWSKRNGIPWIYTAAVGESGYSMLFDNECFECGLGEDLHAAETCETAGIMREVSSAMASLSSHAAVRLLAGKEVTEQLRFYQGEPLKVDSPGCRVCVGGEFPEIEKTEIRNICGEKKFQVELENPDLDAAEHALQNPVRNRELVKGEAAGRTVTVFSSGRAILEARSMEEARQRLSELGV